jgi:hypothetical protein
MPLDGLHTKWRAWLEECAPFLVRAKPAAEKRKFVEYVQGLQRKMMPEMMQRGYLDTEVPTEQDKNNFKYFSKHPLKENDEAHMKRVGEWLPGAVQRYYGWLDDTEETL